MASPDCKEYLIDYLGYVSEPQNYLLARVTGCEGVHELVRRVSKGRNQSLEDQLLSLRENVDRVGMKTFRRTGNLALEADNQPLADLIEQATTEAIGRRYLKYEGLLGAGTLVTESEVQNDSGVTNPALPNAFVLDVSLDSAKVIELYEFSASPRMRSYYKRRIQQIKALLSDEGSRNIILDGLYHSVGAEVDPDSLRPDTPISLVLVEHVHHRRILAELHEVFENIHSVGLRYFEYAEALIIDAILAGGNLPRTGAFKQVARNGTQA